MRYPPGGGGTSTGMKSIDSFGMKDYLEKDLFNYETARRKRKIRSTRGIPVGRGIMPACGRKQSDQDCIIPMEKLQDLQE